mmetsp:Transcript_24403/g.20512  ORF Transcript_24403/g.20512 Transcript_24403/m.20512 type:complete len:126 (-) Transcript_24403:2491-2868(-)
MFLLNYQYSFDFKNPTTEFLGCVILGTILSATDPVAVVGLFKKLGTDKRISTLIEGESLLNDGSAVVMLEILIVVLINIIKTEEDAGAHTEGSLELFIAGLKLAIGSPLLGVVYAYILRQFITRN